MTIEDPGCRTCFTATGLACVHHQRMIDRLPQPSIPPAIEKSLDRRERRKFLGQQSPLTARCQQVQQGIDNFAFRWCAAAPASVASEGALRSVPIPHPSRRLHSEDYRDDTVVEWFSVHILCSRLFWQPDGYTSC